MYRGPQTRNQDPKIHAEPCLSGYQHDWDLRYRYCYQGWDERVVQAS